MAHPQLEQLVDQEYDEEEIDQQRVPAHEHRVRALELKRADLAQLPEGVHRADGHLVGAVAEVGEQVFLLVAPVGPGIVLAQAVAVTRLPEGVDLVVGEADCQVAASLLEAAEIKQRFEALGLPAPGQVEADQVVVVADPRQSFVDQHGLDAVAGKRLDPVLQLVRHAVIADTQAVVGAAPQVAFRVFVFEQFRERTVVALLEVGAAGGQIVVVARQGHGPDAAALILLEAGDIGNLADGRNAPTGTEAAHAFELAEQEGAVGKGRDGQGELIGYLARRAAGVLIDAVRGGHVDTSFVHLGDLPAGVTDLARRDKALPLQAEQALEGTDHQIGAAQGDAGNLAPKALLFREMRINFGHRKAEDTIVRSPPDRTLAVVGKFGDTVGTEAVVDVDTPDFPALCIDGDHTVRRRGQQRPVRAQRQALINLDFIPAVHCGLPVALAAGEHPGVAGVSGRIGDADGVPGHAQDASRLVDSFETDRSVLFHIHAHHAGDVRCMDNPPLDIVIDQQAFKIRKERMPFTVADHVEVAVVGIVLAGRIVLEERYAHVSAVLRDGRDREQQRGGHQDDIIRYPSHLNVIYGMATPT